MEFYQVNKDIDYSDLERFNYLNQKICVIAYIRNEEGKILLQQRGKNSSDERGLYECIGGKTEEKDKTLKDAIIREIEEESGENIKLELSKTIGICHCLKETTNWLFIIYSAKYIKGKFEIKEPDKCIGYKFFDYDELINSKLVSESCRYIVENIHNRNL